MDKSIRLITLIWISVGLATGCVSSKGNIFGGDMPTMKAIHDKKFQKIDDLPLTKPQREVEEKSAAPDSDFQWLPNPTLSMYVFPHLTAAGHPVPGYTTFFRLYIQDHLAQPGEQAGWE